MAALNRLGYLPLSDRDRLEILTRIITQLVPERPDCGLSPESLQRLQRLTQSHLDGSDACRATAENP